MIPRILKDCVDVIETKGIEEIGIYRVSSVVSEVHKMKELYWKNPHLALSEMRQKSPHLAANLLKLYLRELPEPLFTAHLYKRFMKAIELPCPEFRSEELCNTFSELPDANKTIILFILNHLINIANRSDKNMMSSQNLCTLFGPTLMKLSPKDNLQTDDMAKEIKESMAQAQVLFYILQMHAEDRLVTTAASTENQNEDEEQQQQQQQQQQVANNKLTDNSQQQLESPFSKLTIKNIFNNVTGSQQQQQPPARLDNNNNNLNKNSSQMSSTLSSSASAAAASSGQDDRYTKSNMQTAL